MDGESVDGTSESVGGSTTLSMLGDIASEINSIEHHTVVEDWATFWGQGGKNNGSTASSEEINATESDDNEGKVPCPVCGHLCAPGSGLANHISKLDP